MSAPPNTTRNAQHKVVVDERIRTMVADLDRSLTEQQDAEQHAPLSQRMEDRRRHKQDLDLARKAARKVFRVKPDRSTRRAATALLSAGAVGLAAFTGPPIARPQAAELDYAQNRSVMRLPAALLTTSEDFKEALMEEEGVRHTVYRDVAGYPTVGVGHLVRDEDGLEVGDEISDEQVLEFLDGDLAQAERGVRVLVGNLPLHQHEFDALVDLVYNVGLGNVSASESPNLNAAIEARDYDAIAAELDYRHAGGRLARGLKFRSERRANMFTDASYQDPRQGPSTDTA